MVYIEIVIVLALTVINGLLAMSELAIVSSRQARLRALADREVAGARQAVALAADPGRFLSTVQIGITLVGVVSGAFSGATLGLRLSEMLTAAGLPRFIADPAGVGIVVALITYLSLIVGELVPKQVALRNPERVAVRVAPAMTVLARFAKPLVWLLNTSGRLLLRVLGEDAPKEDGVSDEEIKTVIAEAESAGVIAADERKMIAGVMRLGDRSVAGVLTPRTDVEWIDLNADWDTIRRTLIDSKHSRLPAGEDVDTMVGVVQTRDLLAAILNDENLIKSVSARDFVCPAPIVHDTADALDVLAILREAPVPVALVHDEYGHFEGIITPADLMEVIVGAFKADTEAPEAFRRGDGSWLLSGSLPADEMADLLGLTLPQHRDYETVAGFVLAELGRIPTTGESVTAHGWTFEVVDLDGRRIDKVLASRLNTRRRAH
ncbi:HlyC/CorC family transporter [Pseudolabrys taiwanensis]|uniref:HlyC/CorC family transporter n=1 Tax=Pseudolabrys taiwanensis TaxID=331696 RepID=A0A345ZT19_9HYPH|nr:hemolysin family protein [Pseudolabrys taiwanensis]AXK80066.1 HlyC/CorC family transporter [Pseudolabrys taiwanensis]